MISGEMIQMLITGGVVGGTLGFLAAVPYLKKKGVNINTGLNKASTIVNVAGTALDTISPLLLSGITNNLEYIKKWAKIAVGKADQLYHAGEIGKDNRRDTAQNVVDSLLKELKITPTDSMKDLINAAIENAVNESGHVDKTEAEKQAETDALKVQVANITTENANLKSTITQFTNNAASIIKPEVQVSATVTQSTPV